MLGLGNILSKGGAIQKFPNEYSFNFDGSNDYLEVQDKLESVFQASYSISFWVKPDDGQPSSGQSLFGYRTASSSSINNTVQGKLLSNGKLWFRYQDGTNTADTQTNSVIFSDGATDWTHVAIVVNESADQIYIYVNGSVQTLDGTYNGDTSSLTFSDFGAGNNFPIGGRHNLADGVGEFFSGKIDEFAIWSTALDATTIGKISSKPVDLTKYSASNLKLYIRAGDKVLPESTTSIARADYSVDFDGSDYITLGVVDELKGGSQKTISAWINNEDTNNTTFLGNTQSGGYSINIYQNKLRATFHNGDYRNTETTDWSINTWHHVVGTYDNRYAKLYVDGELKHTVDSGSNADLTSVNVAFLIGAEVDADSTPSSKYVNGKISNVAIYNTALPANDIALMAKSRFTPMRDFMLKQVDFDGSDDYIDLNNNLRTWVENDNKTFSAWVKNSGNTSETRIFNVGMSGSSTAFGLGIGYGTANKPFYFLRTSEGAVLKSEYGDVLNTTDWYHLAITVDATASEAYVYQNGVLKATVSNVGTPSQDTDTSAKIGVAWYSTSLNVFEGSIAGCAIYLETKDADFIYAQHAKGLFADWSADTNLVGYWKMGNGTGDTYPTIVDQSSNSNNGTITNGASDDIVENMVAGYDMGSFRGTEVDDTKHLIIDVSNPVLGTELITNGTFDSDVSGWSGTNGSVSHSSSGTGRILVDGGNAYAKQTVSITGNKLYKVSFDHYHLTGTDHGKITVQIYDYFVPLASQYKTGNTYTFYMIPSDNATYFLLGSYFAGTTFELDNISVKEVYGNVGTPVSMDATNFPYTSILPDQSYLTGNSSSYNYFEGDSADEFIDCGTGLASLLGDSYSGKLSVSIWFNQDQTNNTDGFFYIGSHAGSNGVWALYMANSSGLFRLRQNSSSSHEVDISSFTSTYTGWVNVLTTWDGATTTAKLYVNGSLVATDTSMASSINFDAEKTIIGSYFSGSFAINGKVSGTGIWTVDQGDNALAIYNLGRQGNLLNKYSDNLIGFYDIGALDAETGIKNTHTRILDRSGNAFHGSVTSGASSDVVTAPNAEPEGYDIESTTRTTTTP